MRENLQLCGVCYRLGNIVGVESLLREEVVSDRHREVHLERLVVKLVLDGLLALNEGVADLLRLGIVGRGGQLRLKLRLERALGLRQELRTRVSPRAELGRRDRHRRTGEVANLDLRNTGADHT